MKKFTIILLLALLPMISMAGSRGLNIAFVDATTSNTTKEGKRLAELLVMDMKALYTSNLVGEVFPWNENAAEIKILEAKAEGLSFDRLVNPKNPKAIENALEKHRVSDGLIVFYYDRANGYARLKLYDRDGKELILVRFPLEGTNSAMKYSILKGHRRGALSAIGANVRWSP